MVPCEMKSDKKCDRVKRLYAISSECGVNSQLRSLCCLEGNNEAGLKAPVINK